METLLYTRRSAKYRMGAIHGSLMHFNWPTPVFLNMYRKRPVNGILCRLQLFYLLLTFYSLWLTMLSKDTYLTVY